MTVASDTRPRKVPSRALERKSLYDRLTKLELDLTDAIKSERYEDAARARDRINSACRRDIVSSQPMRRAVSRYSILTGVGK